MTDHDRGWNAAIEAAAERLETSLEHPSARGHHWEAAALVRTLAKPAPTETPCRTCGGERQWVSYGRVIECPDCAKGAKP